MNADRMVQMLLRQVLRLVSRRLRNGNGAPGGQVGTRQTRDATRLAKRAARMANRAGRF